MLGEPAQVSELDAHGPPLGELHREPPQRRRERDRRAEHLQVLLPDRRDVDGVRDEPALERRGDLLGHDQARAVLRLLRRGGEVRRHDHAVDLEQRPRVRLLGEDVDRGAGHRARAERLDERRLVHELPARGVHDPDAGRIRANASAPRSRASRRSAAGAP